MDPQLQQILAETLVQRGGYSMADALNAVRGPRAAELAREFGVNTQGAGGDPLSQVNQLLESSFTNLNAEVAKNFKSYQSNNPFRIDEVLAAKTAQAKEQIDPYYNETLSDYLLGVTRKISRGSRDLQDTLGELQAQTESFGEATRFKLTEAINRAQEGFAESGLFSSGERFRTEGKLKATSDMDEEEFARRQALREKGARGGFQDTLEDIQLGRKQTVRDIERNRFTDVEQRKGQLARESGQQYVRGFKATLPPELQAASGFDLLSDLGIYQ